MKQAEEIKNRLDEMFNNSSEYTIEQLIDVSRIIVKAATNYAQNNPTKCLCDYWEDNVELLEHLLTKLLLVAISETEEYRYAYLLHHNELDDEADELILCSAMENTLNDIDTYFQGVPEADITA